MARPVVVCGTVLTGTVITEDRRSTRPRLVFTYRPLARSLAQLLQRPGLEKKCELWRQRYDPVTHKRLQAELLTDIWDGRMWERYQHTPEDLLPRAAAPPPAAHNGAPMDVDGEERKEEEEEKGAAAADHRIPLLSQSGTLALALNLDWFQPFSGQQYSMGGIYMTLLNLPREERYLDENMILVGILPGPGETPRTQLQGALKPSCCSCMDSTVCAWRRPSRLEVGEKCVASYSMWCATCPPPAVYAVSLPPTATTAVRTVRTLIRHGSAAVIGTGVHHATRSLGIDRDRRRPAGAATGGCAPTHNRWSGHASGSTALTRPDTPLTPSPSRAASWAIKLSHSSSTVHAVVGCWICLTGTASAACRSM